MMSWRKKAQNSINTHADISVTIASYESYCEAFPLLYNHQKNDDIP